MEDKDIKKQKSFLSQWGMPLFTLNVCLLSMCVAASNACFVSSTRTIEKHFGFTGTQTSILLAADNITGLVALLILGYLGGKYNKARFTGITAVGLALGNIILTVPYYKSAVTSDIMKYNQFDIISNTTIQSASQKLDILCKTSQNDSSSCLADDGNKGKYFYDKNMFYVFLFGQLVKGIMFGTFMNLPYVYINENSRTDKATFYSGMNYFIIRFRFNEPHFLSICYSVIFTTHVPVFFSRSWHSFRDIGLKFCIFHNFHTANEPSKLKTQFNLLMKFIDLIT